MPGEAVISMEAWVSRRWLVKENGSSCQSVPADASGSVVTTFPLEPRMRRVSFEAPFSLLIQKEPSYLKCWPPRKMRPCLIPASPPPTRETDALLAVLEIDLGDFDMAIA